MAPPRTAKKSSITAAQTASRQGPTARKQVVEEYDEDTQTDCMDMDDEVEDDQLDSSQGTAVQNVIMGGLSNQKKRHVVNKKKVKEDYSRTKTKLQDNITAFFDEHEDQSDTAHRAQLNRLADLLAMKATLESQMTSKLAHLRAAYDAHSKELSTVVDSRIKELK
ncbi:hypothetical protein BU25DRAFT_488894 [Macroventuria anomochaeta]|uniref:Uncharacterized protein n=1 Tax=Macroventuria anomochaeta TaxID=301207 RepID=A0ACB6SAX9_9PLEO|nr:uncharacterized protein BU25DRAFT_488894 [Macroventuria anomochaeta]KAF2630745.1 hypothetical protein BU25DRAFT_488894 [Macroventuria anomochaeta]